MSKWINGSFGLLASLALFASANAFADGGNAVIVINPHTGAWGAASSAYLQDAEASALANCGQDCANIDVPTLESGQSGLKETYSYNGWVAFAYSTTNHWGASGEHDNQADAEQSAYDKCGGEANDCYIVKSFASFDYQPDENGTDINDPQSQAQ
jgi:hypothetical protein